MSSKIPVGATVNEAFRFGMKRWPTVLRYFWFPLVVAILVIAGLVMAMIDFKAAQSVSDAAPSFAAFKSVLRVPFPVFLGVMTLGYVAVFVVMSGAVASIFRLVVHGEERKGIFQLRFDGPAIRVFLASIIVAVINFAVFGAALLVASIISGQAPFSGIGAIFDLFAFASNAKPGATMPTDLAARLATEAKPLMWAWLYALVPMLYLGVKLAPFPAGSAAEDRLVLFGTFRMTFGHWWSIFFSFVLMMVALILLAIVVELSFGIINGIGGALAQQGAAAGAIGGVIMLVSTVAYLFYQLIVLGVQLALSAVIYRRLAYGE